ncbi:hypothetical protein Ddc_22127 [Ditylenchus destructor]|nr:hypothetical protein Ddc_22127 [Ditylenchus destructor]
MRSAPARRPGGRIVTEPRSARAVQVLHQRADGALQQRLFLEAGDQAVGHQLFERAAGHRVALVGHLADEQEELTAVADPGHLGGDPFALQEQVVPAADLHAGDPVLQGGARMRRVLLAVQRDRHRRQLAAVHALMRPAGGQLRFALVEQLLQHFLGREGGALGRRRGGRLGLLDGGQAAQARGRVAASARP